MDTAALGLRIESSSLEKGVLNLKELDSQSAKTEASVSGMAKKATSGISALAKASGSNTSASKAMVMANLEFEKASLRVGAATDKLALAQSKYNQILSLGPQPLQRTAQASANLQNANARLIASQQSVERAQMRIASASRMQEASIEGVTSATKASTTALAVNSAAMARNNATVKAGSFQTANLASQFNDIGVMLAAGQSPITLALQQGTQISQVLNTMGGGANILRSLGSAALSVVNPVSLMTIGLIAGTAALTQWAMGALSAGDEAEGLSKRLEDTRESLASFKQELREITLGISSEELTLLDAIRAQTDELALAQERLRKSSGQGKRAGKIGVRRAQEELDLLNTQLDSLRQMEQQRETLKTLTAQTADNERLLGEQMMQTAGQLDEANRLAELLRAGVSATTIEALELSGIDLSSPIVDAEVAAKLLELGLSNSQIQAIELSGISISGPITAAANEAERLANNLFLASRVGLRKTVSDEDALFSQPVEAAPSTGAVSNFSRLVEAANKRTVSSSAKAANATARTAERAAKKAKDAADRVKEAWGDATDKIKQQTNDLLFEANSIGIPDEIATQLAKEQELVNLAMQNGMSITPQLTTEIENLASGYSSAEMAMEKAKKEQESYTNGVEFARNTTNGFLDDFSESFARTGDLWESAKKAGLSALNDIRSELTKMASEGLISALFNGANGGGGGGLFGSIFGGIGSLLGFSSGGYTGNGGVADVAGVVHGQEYVVNARATQKFRPQLEMMNSGIMPANSNAAPSQPQEIIVRGVFVDDQGVVKARIDNSTQQMGAQVKNEAIGTVKGNLQNWSSQLKRDGKL